MTKKKSRNVQPACNLTLVALCATEEPLTEGMLNKVLDKFCDAEAWPKLSKRIYQAIADYHTKLKANPQRRNAQKQRDDQHELIECMKELDTRLDPLYIPPPMLKAARSAYTCYAQKIRYERENIISLDDSEIVCTAIIRGKPVLIEEIHDLRLRLSHLQRLFEATEIPAPDWTNPGKPERDCLVGDLDKIFNDYTKGRYRSNLPERQERRKQFVQGVFAVFPSLLPKPTPRLF